jgi:hypothetical protein
MYQVILLIILHSVMFVMYLEIMPFTQKFKNYLMATSEFILVTTLMVFSEFLGDTQDQPE